MGFVVQFWFLPQSARFDKEPQREHALVWLEVKLWGCVTRQRVRRKRAHQWASWHSVDEFPLQLLRLRIERRTSGWHAGA